jgi:hypothetical protein
VRKKILKIIIILILIGAVWFVLRFVIGGSEDTWICVDGEWVKHGAPSAPKPTEPCNGKDKIANFNDCAKAGYAVMESYPRQCRAPEGETFVEDIGNELEKMDLIRIADPRPNQEVISPINTEGEARGFWFFEADFPIKLLDDKGNELANGFVRATKGWMTEDFVPFEGLLEFTITEEMDAILVLEKDNPSGLPENADELRVPIHLIPSQSSKVEGWKVYTDEEKGFSINYLPEMTLLKEAGGIKFVFIGPTQGIGTELYDGIIFYVFKEAYEQDTLKDFVDAEIEKKREFEVVVSDREEFILTGMTGYSYIVEGLGTFTNIILDAGPGEAIKITYIAPDPQNQGFQQTVNTMMSTLELLK